MFSLFAGRTKFSLLDVLSAARLSEDMPRFRAERFITLRGSSVVPARRGFQETVANYSLS